MRKVTVEDIKNILKNEYFIITITTILAFLIRLIHIDKPYGFWYDEMLTYIFSAKDYPLGILKVLSREDFHMPLYYLYVGGWMKLFGTSDAILRISSVLCGALTVPAFFFMGKTYKSKELGYLLAVFACLSPLLIYYSQELRFYSMLMLFSALSVTFLLKLLDNPDKKNFILFGLSNLVILYIYTMGIVFVGLEFFVLLVNFYFYKKEDLTKFAKFSAFFLGCAIPYLIILTSYLIADKNSLINPFVWFGLAPHSILFIINDWFNTIFLGLYDNDINKWRKFYVLTKILVSTAPACFIVGLIANFIKPNKKFLYLFFILASFLLTEIYLCLFKDFILLTRYTLVALPIAFLLCTGGILSIKFKPLKKTLITLILIVFLLNLANYKHSATFDERLNGLKPSQKSLDSLNLKKTDYYLFAVRSELSKKYIPEVNMINFDISGVLILDKTKNEALKIFNKDFVARTNRKNAMQNLTLYLLSKDATPELKNYINSEIANIPKGSRLITLDTRPNPVKESKRIKIIEKNLANKEAYKAEFFALIYDKIFDDITDTINKNNSLQKVGTVIDFDKKNKVRYWKFTIYKKS